MTRLRYPVKPWRSFPTNGEVWESKPRAPENRFKVKLHSKLKLQSKRKAQSSESSRASAKFFEPMKATLAKAAPSGDWLYEIKFDGFRALAMLNDGEVRLLSRNEKDFGSKFPISWTDSQS